MNAVHSERFRETLLVTKTATTAVGNSRTAAAAVGNSETAVVQTIAANNIVSSETVRPRQG
jgi:hypothetical protein